MNRPLRFEDVTLTCPFCNRSKVACLNTLSPREKVDCRCGAVAESRVAQADDHKTIRVVEWDAPSPD